MRTTLLLCMLLGQWQIGQRSFAPTSNFKQGMVECWLGNDGSGNSFADGCGTGNTETLVAGSLTWATNAGLPGTTATFSSTAYLKGINQTATNFTGATPFSVSAWIILNGAGGATIISTLDPANNYVGWEFVAQYPGSNFLLHGFLINTYPSNAIEVGATNPVSTGTLHNVVMTYSAATKTAADVSFYLDGVLCTNAAPVENSLTGSIANTKDATLGARTDGTSPINGVEAFIHIWNRQLSQADVTNYYTAGPK
jgi:Concanavalin A-like lectin/glucanases superfamily